MSRVGHKRYNYKEGRVINKRSFGKGCPSPEDRLFPVTVINHMFDAFGTVFSLSHHRQPFL